MKTPEQELEDLGGERLAASGFETDLDERVLETIGD
jgi:hypothetical protein